MKKRIVTIMLIAATLLGLTFTIGADVKQIEYDAITRSTVTEKCGYCSVVKMWRITEAFADGEVVAKRRAAKHNPQGKLLPNKPCNADYWRKPPETPTTPTTNEPTAPTTDAPTAPVTVNCKFCYRHDDNLCQSCSLCRDCNWYWYGITHCLACDVCSHCAKDEGIKWCVLCFYCAGCCKCESATLVMPGTPTGRCVECGIPDVPRCTSCQICYECSWKLWGNIIDPITNWCGTCMSMYGLPRPY